MSKTNTTSSPVELPNAGNHPTGPHRLEGGTKGEAALFLDEAARLIWEGIDTFVQNEVIKAHLAINEYLGHYYAELYFDVGGKQVTPNSTRLRFRYQLNSWPQPEVFEVGMSIIWGRATLVVCEGGRVAFDEVTVCNGPGEPW